MLYRLFLILLLFFPFLTHTEPSAFIQPPKDWQVADPKTYAPSVEICFVHKGKTPIPLTINLAKEKIDINLKEYLKAVKALHEGDKKNRWKELGPLKTASGEAILTQIDTTTNGQPMQLFQLILYHEKTAYVITAGAAKQEIGAFYPIFLQTFKSLTITQNLLDSLSDQSQKDHLMSRIVLLQNEAHSTSFEKKAWASFQKTFLKEYAHMGTHWQILMLKEILENCKSGDFENENQ
jgi:hypothetical protein